jgi:hypothetical protein
MAPPGWTSTPVAVGEREALAVYLTALARLGRASQGEQGS